MVLQLGSRPPVAGEDLILGLDIRVQKVAEEGIGRQTRVDSGTRSAPGRCHRAHEALGDLDPNDFVRGLSVAQYSALQNDIDKPLLNRALRGACPHDSTVGPLMRWPSRCTGSSRRCRPNIAQGSSRCAAEPQQVP